MWRELHNYSFRDVDKLQSINTDKKRRIISKVMYIELGDYDPSNEYVANYSDSKTIRLYRKLTEKRIDAEALYTQIYNQLTKQRQTKTYKTLQLDMEQAADANNTSRKTTKNHKLKILTVNVNGFNNFNKRTEIF